MIRKYFLFLLVLITNCKYAQEKKISGVVVVYYTKKIPQYVDPPALYCLDSIRLFSDKISIPLYGDHVQHEYFLYLPVSKVTYYGSAIRHSPLYCSNRFENYIHKGGEIFERNNEPGKIFIAFNIIGKGFLVLPNINSLKDDSLFNDLEINAVDFLKYNKTESCPYNINNNAYIILSEDFISTPLTKRQQRKFKFKKSNITEFLRYGLW